jgi:hypothetical protein
MYQTESIRKLGHLYIWTMYIMKPIWRYLIDQETPSWACHRLKPVVLSSLLAFLLVVFMSTE